MIALGLDGFRNGWVVVRLDGKDRSISFPENISEALKERFDRAAIDIPIGLSHDGIRECDLEAREKLRPHGCRVFTGARRWLWNEFDDPDLANVEAARRGQKRVSRQLWHLGRKIREVDLFILAHRHLQIYETHPELVFLRLNSWNPLPSKHSDDGLRLRKHLLGNEGFAELDSWLGQCRIGSGAKKDDVLDACAAALAAEQLAAHIPDGVASRDAQNLPMQIWY